MPDHLTPAQRVALSRMGAYALHAKRDPKETTAAARAAFDRRFVVEADPDGTLPEAERERIVKALRHKYFAGLALKRATAARKRAS